MINDRPVLYTGLLSQKISSLSSQNAQNSDVDWSSPTMVPSKSDTTRIAAALGFFVARKKYILFFGDGDDDDDDADDVRAMEDGVLVACRQGRRRRGANRKEFARKLLARLRPENKRTPRRWTCGDRFFCERCEFWYVVSTVVVTFYKCLSNNNNNDRNDDEDAKGLVGYFTSHIASFAFACLSFTSFTAALIASSVFYGTMQLHRRQVQVIRDGCF